MVQKFYIALSPPPPPGWYCLVLLAYLQSAQMVGDIAGNMLGTFLAPVLAHQQGHFLARVPTSLDRHLGPNSG